MVPSISSIAVLGAGHFRNTKWGQSQALRPKTKLVYADRTAGANDTEGAGGWFFFSLLAGCRGHLHGRNTFAVPRRRPVGQRRSKSVKAAFAGAMRDEDIQTDL